MYNIARMPTGCGGYYPGRGGGNGSPYDSGKERQRHQANMAVQLQVLAAMNARRQAQMQAQQPRQFGRSHRWGTSQYSGGPRPRTPQFSFGSPHTPLPPLFGQRRPNPFAMPMRRPASTPFSSMYRPSPFRPLYAPRHSPAYPRFNSSLLSRGYPPPRPYFSSRQYYQTPDKGDEDHDNDDDDDDDEDPFADDDDDWGESEAENNYGYESRGEDDNEYYDDYSSRRPAYTPYRNYSPNVISGYGYYGNEDYRDDMRSQQYSRCSRDYGRPSPRYAAW